MASPQEQGRQENFLKYYTIFRRIWRTPERSFIFGLAQKEGPDFVLEIFNLIPPEQISRRNFEQRLVLERRLREHPEQNIEREIKVRGVIQDVNFREFCKRRAFTWGITHGFARNEPDGSVMILVQSYPSILDAFSDGDDFRKHAGEVSGWIKIHELQVSEDRHMRSKLAKFYILSEYDIPRELRRR
ncbi:hypothetical protein CO054_01160 [Candidatus Shapirobacteria bacterium CG_4_9_14_0_2_um_filter_39_11]|uniref:acylphosphatase n=1 Tax=Candidatus Shapirobacteria bacterium CG_4_9_14_0_2_um_filter_39_11 TaxID=1974478 RepID=A0A2M8ESZ0_9BACT|nr:MAG: hypothetical protein CO054_01160 [Candidatus Shapirobacteria bacterium CG_4_9_14_0_2_um_filter_39_11]